MQKLIDIFGNERVVLGTAIPKVYLETPLLAQKGIAQALVFPKSTQEVQDLALYAKEQQYHLIPRGAGTGVTGATFPIKGEILIDFSQMNQITAFDEATRTLFVEPGVTLEEIQTFVEAKGYLYPPDPGSNKATIGGTVATNAGGMRAVKYGVTRNYVRQMVVVLASGEKMTVGSLTEKNSSGYDLKDLFIGSEGTLGMITEIALRLVVPPKITQSLLVGFDYLSDVSKTVNALLSSAVNPTALEFFEEEGIAYSQQLLGLSFPLKQSKNYLLLTVDGNQRADVEERLEQALALADNNQRVEYRHLSDEVEAQVWKLRGAIVSGIEAVTKQEPLDIVVPIDKITETIEKIKQMGQTYDLATITFGHAGDGNIHVCILKNAMTDDRWEKQLAVFLSELYHYVALQKGLPSAEHGIGLLKKSYFLKEIDPTVLTYLRQIKAVFDPENRLNPTKMM